MDKKDLNEGIAKAVESCDPNPFNPELRGEFAERLYESFLANPKLMVQLPELGYEDLEDYIHDKMKSTNQLLDGLDDETLETLANFPRPTTKL